eukprot:GHVQ01039850.1.p1 GENE.GHVQ01039850.1~~GHVQ01039850.1.p1  ORF type:complete len:1585 (-),score=326.71 GHVQ01039850.1:2759-7513(-)
MPSSSKINRQSCTSRSSHKRRSAPNAQEDTSTSTSSFSKKRKLSPSPPPQPPSRISKVHCHPRRRSAVAKANDFDDSFSQSDCDCVPSSSRSVDSSSLSSASSLTHSLLDSASSQFCNITQLPSEEPPTSSASTNTLCNSYRDIKELSKCNQTLSASRTVSSTSQVILTSPTRGCGGGDSCSVTASSCSSDNKNKFADYSPSPLFSGVDHDRITGYDVSYEHTPTTCLLPTTRDFTNSHSLLYQRDVLSDSLPPLPRRASQLTHSLLRCPESTSRTTSSIISSPTLSQPTTTITIASISTTGNNNCTTSTSSTSTTAQNLLSVGGRDNTLFDNEPGQNVEEEPMISTQQCFIQPQTQHNSTITSSSIHSSSKAISPRNTSSVSLLYRAVSAAGVGLSSTNHFPASDVINDFRLSDVSVTPPPLAYSDVPSVDLADCGSKPVNHSAESIATAEGESTAADMAVGAPSAPLREVPLFDESSSTTEEPPLKRSRRHKHEHEKLSQLVLTTDTINTRVGTWSSPTTPTAAARIPSLSSTTSEATGIVLNDTQFHSTRLLAPPRPLSTASQHHPTAATAARCRRFHDCLFDSYRHSSHCHNTVFFPVNSLVWWRFRKKNNHFVPGRIIITRLSECVGPMANMAKQMEKQIKARKMCVCVQSLDDMKISECVYTKESLMKLDDVLQGLKQNHPTLPDHEQSQQEYKSTASQPDEEITDVNSVRNVCDSSSFGETQDTSLVDVERTCEEDRKVQEEEESDEGRRRTERKEKIKKIASALQKNYSLMPFPLPVRDLQQLLLERCFGVSARAAWGVTRAQKIAELMKDRDTQNASSLVLHRQVTEFCITSVKENTPHTLTDANMNYLRDTPARTLIDRASNLPPSHTPESPSKPRASLTPVAAREDAHVVMSSSTEDLPVSLSDHRSMVMPTQLKTCLHACLSRIMIDRDQLCTYLRCVPHEFLRNTSGLPFPLPLELPLSLLRKLTNRYGPVAAVYAATANFLLHLLSATVAVAVLTTAHTSRASTSTKKTQQNKVTSNEHKRDAGQTRHTKEGTSRRRETGGGRTKGGGDTGRGVSGGQFSGRARPPTYSIVGCLGYVHGTEYMCRTLTESISNIGRNRKRESVGDSSDGMKEDSRQKAEEEESFDLFQVRRMWEMRRSNNGGCNAMVGSASCSRVDTTSVCSTTAETREGIRGRSDRVAVTMSNAGRCREENMEDEEASMRGQGGEVGCNPDRKNEGLETQQSCGGCSGDAEANGLDKAGSGRSSRYGRDHHVPYKNMFSSQSPPPVAQSNGNGGDVRRGDEEEGGGFNEVDKAGAATSGQGGVFVCHATSSSCRMYNSTSCTNDDNTTCLSSVAPDSATSFVSGSFVSPSSTTSTGHADSTSQQYAVAAHTTYGASLCTASSSSDNSQLTVPSSTFTNSFEGGSLASSTVPKETTCSIMDDRLAANVDFRHRCESSSTDSRVNTRVGENLGHDGGCVITWSIRAAEIKPKGRRLIVGVNSVSSEPERDALPSFDDSKFSSLWGPHLLRRWRQMDAVEYGRSQIERLTEGKSGFEGLDDSRMSEWKSLYDMMLTATAVAAKASGDLDMAL